MLSKEKTIEIIKPRITLSASTINTYLSDASKNGKINRIKRGVYLLPNIRNKFVIATQTINNGYIAFHTALEFHGLHTSTPDCVQIASKNRFRFFQFNFNTFVRTPQTASTGVLEYKTPEGNIKCTSITRTLVDCILRPDLSGGPQELWNAFLVISPKDIDYKELRQILEEIDTKSIYQKVGYYFNRFQNQTGAPDDFLEFCRKKCKNVVCKIQIEQNGKFNKEWNAIVPAELDEDKGKTIQHYLTNEEKNQILFLSGIIEEYKKTHNLSNENALKILETKGMLDWLNNNWEILHTTGFQNVIEEIDEKINTR